MARHSELHTFVVFNKRRRVTSSAKRSRAPGSMVLAQTPDGSFRDLMNNARELLLDHCGFSAVPEVRCRVSIRHKGIDPDLWVLVLDLGGRVESRSISNLGVRG